MKFWTDATGPPLTNPDGSPVRDPVTGLLTYGPPIPAPPEISAEDVRPWIDDVAALERTRTVDEGGTDQGTFTESTHPSAAEVEEIIDAATVEVLAQLPPQIDLIWREAIQRAIALRSAFTIETSFFRETQATSGPAAEYGRRFTTDLEALRAMIPKATYLA